MSVATIDVNVKADPVSCRELASWLKTLSQANHDGATAVLKAVSSSESFWHGQASDTFRDQMSRSAREIDDLVQAIDRAASGVELFADDIETVRQRMTQCLQIAHDAGLAVIGSSIQKPPGGPADTASEGASGDMPGLDPKRAEHAAAERKLEAWREIESTADDARRYERTAHRSLLKALDASNTVIAAITATPLTWISRGLAYAGTAHGAATTLAQNAESMRSFAENFQRWAADSTMPASLRESNLRQLLLNAGMDQRAADSNARLLGNTGRTAAGDLLLKRLTTSLAGTSTKEGVFRNTARAFSVVGVAAAGIFTGLDIAAGKPVGKAIAVNFGALGASTAAGAGASALMAGAGAAGAPVTLTGLGVGFAAATAWTYFQENDLRDLYRDLGGDGIDSPDDNSDEYRKGRFGR
ncbi:hypothetical protein [Saccharopolyspora taberi]|uniref:WXG100 family type VII secretion target n=1 Tax=Saccharopolyspora taberi TaxID=60895 RepID=A0ABN3VA08_9PSEU